MTASWECKIETADPVIFLGFVIPASTASAVFAIDTLPAVQTHKFGWSLARALVSTGRETVVLSACPVQNFPHCRKITFPFSKLSEGGVRGYVMPFLNVLVLKHVTRLLMCLLMLPAMVARTKAKWIIIHGTHSPFLIAALACKLLSVKVAVVLTDMPGVPVATDGRVSALLKRYDAAMLNTLVSKADALIALSPHLVSAYPRHPALIFPGIVDRAIADIAQGGQAAPSRSLTVVYAGSLNEAYGVGMLLDAMKLIPDGVKLKLFGRGDQETRIVEVAALDARVTYGGFKSMDDLMPELLDADILINPRPSNEAFSINSFPSKLIEYMALGRPVLTTRLRSIPQTFHPHLNFIDDESPRGIMNALKAVRAVSSDALQVKAANAREFVLQELSEQSIGQKIDLLLKHLSK